jgi:hypothetical protein
LEVPSDAGAFSDPAFVKGFDAFSAQVKTAPGGPLLSRAEASRFANEVLVIVQKGSTLPPEVQKELATTAAVFSANPYSLTASLAFQNAFLSFLAVQQWALLNGGSPAVSVDDVFQKASYLYGMRLRLNAHTSGLARSADWERARSAYPGGPKKFDRALAPRKTR